jgi:hypothetical protein
MALDPAATSRRAVLGSEDFAVLTRSALKSAHQLRGRLTASLGTFGPLDDRQTYKRWFDAAFETEVAHYAEKRWIGTASPVGRYKKYLANAARSRDGRVRAITVQNGNRIRAWSKVRGQLLEIVVLLQLLDEGLREPHAGPVDLDRGCGPITLDVGRSVWQVWYQPAMTAVRSGLKARPDICVTVDAQPPSESNVVYIVECKNVAELGAQTVRSEFGKARDLGVASYVLLSYYPVSERVASGAERLGLRVVDSGLYGSRRSVFTSEMRPIGADVVGELRSAIAANAMLEADASDSREIERKLRLLPPGTGSRR